MRRYASLIWRSARSYRQICRQELWCHSLQALPCWSVLGLWSNFAGTDYLCHVGHTVGVDDGIDDADLAESERRYKSAMDWLTAPPSSGTTQTRIDIYRDKQNSYTDAFERKVKAFDDALDRAMKDPANNTVALQRAAYDKWVAENHKTYNNNVQAAYMDWVTLGKKEEVEYYFAIVDNDSAMARVEASKVCGFVNA